MRSRRGAVTSLAAALTIAVLLLTITRVSGQRFGRGGRGRNRIPQTSALLESAKSLKCSFSAATTARWENGEPQVQSKTSPNAFTLTITGIDTQEGTAQVAGGFGPGEHVTAKLVGSTLHFLDIGLNGALAVTTVFSKETHDGRVEAVYSRAAYTENGFGGPSQPDVSQSYGDCEIGR